MKESYKEQIKQLKGRIKSKLKAKGETKEEGHVSSQGGQSAVEKGKMSSRSTKGKRKIG